LTLATYPIVLFDGPVKFVLFTVIPAGFISLPIEALRTMNLESAVLTVFGSLAVLAAGILIFYLGLRRHESGNLLEMRG
jgi:ABC-2 type transport system permease protein